MVHWQMKQVMDLVKCYTNNSSVHKQFLAFFILVFTFCVTLIVILILILNFRILFLFVIANIL